MENTTHLQLPLLAQNQAGKDITVNEALLKIDMVLGGGLLGLAENNPPLYPAKGDMYVIGGQPTGVWQQQEGMLAFYYGGWRFIKPVEGMILWHRPSAMWYGWDGQHWHPLTYYLSGQV